MSTVVHKPRGQRRGAIHHHTSNLGSSTPAPQITTYRAAADQYDRDGWPRDKEFRCAFANASEHQFASRRLNLRALRGAYWIAPAPSRPSLACRRGRMCES